MMRRTEHLMQLLTILVAASLAATGCGSKRPPALTGASGAPPPATSGRGAGTPTTATSPTEDVQPLSSDQTYSEDFPSYETAGESSPLDDVRFAFDSSSLDDDARATLRRHADWLRDNARVRVTVEGHCDERGTVDYNLALGEKRARAAYDYLIAIGVPAARLRTVSLGKERPLDASSSEEAWAKNRRAHFVVSQ